MIEELGKNMGKTICDVKEDPEPIMIENLSDKDILLIMLKKMISEKKYNEAEDTLFEFLQSNKSEELMEIGEWFYKKLNDKSDIDLTKNNFNRSEVDQGLKEFRLKLNY